MFFNLFDSHMHSSRSSDGHDCVEALANAALQQGLSGIAVTDHLEFDKFDVYNYAGEFPKSMQDVTAAKEAFRGRLDIAAGVELGQPFADLALVEQMLTPAPLDFIIGSVHRVKGWPDLHTMDCAWMGESTIDELMHSYFDDVDELIRWGRFDVLGHLSFPLRSAKRNSDVQINICRYRDRTDRIFRALIAAGKGIEINTSGLRGPLRETMPSFPLVRRYQELGGEIITLGSDAHTTRDVGAGIQQAMEILQRAGFDYFSFYRERKPVMLRVL